MRKNKNIADEEEPDDKVVFYQCVGPNCRKKAGKRLGYYIKKFKLEGKVEVQKIGCTNRCDNAPVLHLDPHNKWFSEGELAQIFKKILKF